MPLFNNGSFTLHSGQHSEFLIDCNMLTTEDLEAIAAELARRLPPFGQIYGIPRGGIRLAAAMRAHSWGTQPLIVDDVLTTGRSMEEAARASSLEPLGAVIFARGPCPGWVTPLFEMRAS